MPQTYDEDQNASPNGGGPMLLRSAVAKAMQLLRDGSMDVAIYRDGEDSIMGPPQIRECAAQFGII